MGGIKSLDWSEPFYSEIKRWLDKSVIFKTAQSNFLIASLVSWEQHKESNWPHALTTPTRLFKSAENKG